MFFLRCLLLPFSYLYYCGLLIDRFIHSFRCKELPKPVISIGNLSVGGTGKTPLLFRAVADLTRLNLRPAVLTRGYRGVLKNANGTQNDEAELLNEKFPNLPIGIGADRYAQGITLEKKDPIDVFLLDDGFQHWPLQRRVDIVCVDATRSFTQEALLPAGRLREPACALSRADLVVLTRSELASPHQLDHLRQDVKRWNSEAPMVSPHFEASLYDPVSGARSPLSTLQGSTVLAVSAIGNPDAFEESLRRAGAKVRPFRRADHHDYNEQDVAEMKKTAGCPLVTTEKDWVKLRQWNEELEESFPRIYVVSLQVSFSESDEKIWMDALLKGVRK